MSDLLTQLGEYGTQLDSQAVPLDELLRAERSSDIPVIGVFPEGGKKMSTQIRPHDQHQTRPDGVQPLWRGVLAFGTALVLVLAAIGTIWLLRSEPEPAAGPVAVFSWGDDLSMWVTEAEMTNAFEDLARTYAGVGFDGEVVVQPGEGLDGVAWRVGTSGDPTSWVFAVHNGSHMFDDGVVSLRETNPRLPEGVTYGTGGWGVYTFAAPNTDESVCMTVEPPREIFGDRVEDQVYEAMLFDLASMTLREMGWAD
jgi:hypothetical protein